MEIFWPAAVFLAVLIVRLQFPPEQVSTCYYNTKAMPSAGPVTFLQSLVCNLDNPCIKSKQYQEIPQYPNSKIHQMVDQLNPLLTDKTVANVIREMPKGIRFIATIVDAISQSDMRHLLEHGVPINNVIRDNGSPRLIEYIKRSLLEQVNLLTTTNSTSTSAVPTNTIATSATHHAIAPTTATSTTTDLETTVAEGEISTTTTVAYVDSSLRNVSTSTTKPTTLQSTMTTESSIEITTQQQGLSKDESEIRFNNQDDEITTKSRMKRSLPPEFLLRPDEATYIAKLLVNIPLDLINLSQLSEEIKRSTIMATTTQTTTSAPVHSDSDPTAIVNGQESTTNITSSSGPKSLKEIICSPASLANHIKLYHDDVSISQTTNFSEIFLSEQISLERFSQSLCLLNDNQIDHFILMIQDEFDFVKILQLLSIMLQRISQDDILVRIDEIQTMIETIDKSNIFTSFSGLITSSWAKELLNLVRGFSSGEIEMKTLLKIASDIEPLLSRVSLVVGGTNANAPQTGKSAAGGNSILASYIGETSNNSANFDESSTLVPTTTNTETSTMFSSVHPTKIPTTTEIADIDGELGDNLNNDDIWSKSVLEKEVLLSSSSDTSSSILTFDKMHPKQGLPDNVRQQHTSKQQHSRKNEHDDDKNFGLIDLGSVDPYPNVRNFQNRQEQQKEQDKRPRTDRLSKLAHDMVLESKINDQTQRHQQQQYYNRRQRRDVPVNASEVDSIRDSNNFSDVLRTMIPLDLHQLKLLQAGMWGAAVVTTGSSYGGTSDSSPNGDHNQNENQSSSMLNNKNNNDNNNLLNEIDSGVGAGLESKILSKIVSNMDKWIDMVEKFTVTPKWTSLMRIFQGTEAILGMLAQTQNSPGAITSNTNNDQHQQQQAMISTNTSEFERLMQRLPGRVQTLTSALNHLFPWHVWPWNNVDLYKTVDTFLSHGIFAFNQTTLGPNRRIDYLADLINTLQKSLSFGTFPRKCIDWSEMVCDTEKFTSRMIEADNSGQKKRRRRYLSDSGEEYDANNTTFGSSSDENNDSGNSGNGNISSNNNNNKNKLMQELACMMFSSLSMQQLTSQTSSALNNTAQEIKRHASSVLSANEATSSGQFLSVIDGSLELLNAGLALDKNGAMTNSRATTMNDSLQDNTPYSGNSHGDVDYSITNEKGAQVPGGNSGSSPLLDSSEYIHDPINNVELKWDKLIEKSLQLYVLSRQALTDQQWQSLYQLINHLWSQEKIPNRVIIVSRIIQLLADCHVPQEMLKSALWKDIYKYKNVINQIVNIAIDEMNSSAETGTLAVEQLSFGSQQLHIIIKKFIQLLPHLIESLTQTITDDMPKLVENILTINKFTLLKLPCKGSSIADIIPSLETNRSSIMELEQLICNQLRIKPLVASARAANLTSQIVSNTTPTEGTHLVDGVHTTKMDDFKINRRHTSEHTTGDTGYKNNVSVIDEFVANPRLSSIVAILQSSTLDPPETHEQLPELDWVEAGTSAALFYDSIQRLISAEENFILFPEIEGYDQKLKRNIEKSQQKFKEFSRRGPARLIAYSMDIVLPIAMKTFASHESFHNVCLLPFSDIFSEDIEGKVSRQWQCLISSLKFGSWGINSFLQLVNKMFSNVLNHIKIIEQNTSNLKTTMSNKDIYSPLISSNHDNTAITFSRDHPITETNISSNASCIFFDSSISIMLDNLPQFIDLSLETVLLASTSSNQQLDLSLYDILCSSNYMLDPFNEKAVKLKARLKHKMCHLFNKKSMTICANLIQIDSWAQTMKMLNSTWFESSAAKLQSSFSDILLEFHKFLELFGQFKPGTSDSLIAKVLNINSFWTDLLKKLSSIIDKYQEKRFEYALQTLTPIIYDNLPISVGYDHNDNDSRQESSNTSINSTGPGNNTLLAEIKETLITTILGARAILNFLENNNQTGSNQERYVRQIQTLFDWADQYSMLSAEVILKTIADDIEKLEDLFKPSNELNRYGTDGLEKQRLTLKQVWRKFCSAPADRYLAINRLAANNISISEEIAKGKDEMCAFPWDSLYNQLSADSNHILFDYPERRLTRIALTKWGQVLDVMLIESKQIKQLPKFFYTDYWQLFRDKLPQISPLKEEPSNLVWIWQGFERVVNAMDSGSNQTSNSLIKILDQVNCGLDAVKGGLSWDNIANIYQDKPDILAAHSTINSGFALASVGLNTFLIHKKFQKFLDELVKPKVGLNAFCDLKDRQQLEAIFAIPGGQDFLGALESLQELVCDTDFETLAKNLNPISVCYQSSPSSTNNKFSGSHPLANIMDRFFKLASLAVLDAKLVAASDVKPPVLDKNQWATFWNWWSDQVQPHPKSSFTLTIIRAFQLVDSITANHVVWKALFRSIHEVSETTAYIFRAIEKKAEEDDDSKIVPSSSRAAWVVSDATKRLTKSQKAHLSQSQNHLASALSNIMFPEVNNFISIRTFKQLRWIKMISTYFATTSGAQDSICKTMGNSQQPQQTNTVATSLAANGAYNQENVKKMSTEEKLFSLLCKYHPTQWISAINFALSTRTLSIHKKVNYMTKYLSIFIRNYKNYTKLEDHIHAQQMENIESVAGTSVAYLLAATHALKSLSFGKISNSSWHSLPQLLDSIDRYVCASKHERGTFLIPNYQPKTPDLETLICKLPQWNFTQAYYYISDHLDLRNMVSIMAHNSSTPMCVTPFKFGSRWLQVAQEVVDEMLAKSTRELIKKCFTTMRRESLWSHSLRYARFTNGLMTAVNQIQASNSWPVVRQTWNSISYLILNQVPTYMPIKKLLKNSRLTMPNNKISSIISSLQPEKGKNSSSAMNDQQVVADKLLSSSFINVNAFAWKNFSNVALQEMICGGNTSYRKYVGHLGLPIIVTANQQTNNSNPAVSESSVHQQQQTSKNIVNYLCGDDGRGIENLVANLDISKIESQLPQLQRLQLGFSGWLERLTADFKHISPQFKNIYLLGFDLTSGRQTGGSVVSLIQLTREKTLKSLIRQVNEIVEKLEPKIGQQGPIGETLAVIQKGLLALDTFASKNLFKIVYQFKDFIKNIEPVEFYMTFQLGLEPAVTQAILDSSIDLTDFIAESLDMVDEHENHDPNGDNSKDSTNSSNNLLCNHDQLSKILTIPNNSESGQPTATMDLAISAICALSTVENYRFTSNTLKQLATRKIINNFAGLISGKVLTKAQLSYEDVPFAINGLKVAAKAMPSVKGFISNFTDSLDLQEELSHLTLSGDSLELLSSPHAATITSKIMCGKANLPALANEFSLLRKAIDKPNIKQEELDRLKSQFCRKGYEQVMRLRGGPIIWSFLKQILAGKILYTPRNRMTSSIMERMNGTFQFMSGFTQTLQSWTQTISSLEDFHRSPHANDQVFQVQHLMVRFLGRDVQGLFADVDSSEVIEKLTKSGAVLGVVQLMGNIAQCFELDRFIGFETEAELELEARKLSRNHEFLAAIVFINEMANRTSNQLVNEHDDIKISDFPHNIEYKIRTDVAHGPGTKMIKDRFWEPGPRGNHMTDFGYLRGFIQIQEMVDRAIISLMTNRTQLDFDPAVHLQQFPYACFQLDRFGNYIRALMPMIGTVAWIFLIAFLIRDNVLQRELHLEEFLRVAGLKPTVAWLVWFTIGAGIMIFGTGCAIGILNSAGLIPNSNRVILFLFFLAFALSILMYCYMMSTFFITTTIASLSGIVCYLATFLPFMVAITLEHELTFIFKLFTCSSMSTAFCFGMMYMTRYEIQGVGLQWSNIWHSPIQDDAMNLASAMSMLLVDSLIYFLIGWYKYNVFPPGNNAQSQCWYFFILPSYWTKNVSMYKRASSSGRSSRHRRSASSSCAQENLEAGNIQRNILQQHHQSTLIGAVRHKSDRPSQDRKLTVEIQPGKQEQYGMSLHNLYVVYKNKNNPTSGRGSKTKKSRNHVAVSNLSLQLKEGQITTLLGTNGAGKTTTISVLTGQILPTSGQCYIYGYKVPQQFTEARKLLGYCPQYNTLFMDLTVMEHLIFYSKLKALLPLDQLEDDVKETLIKTGLWHVRNELAKSLSGGLQRRLCVALAFVGGSKLIILDEPTSSVDPVARRKIWDLIVQQKQNRTVLLTTHHMDEADILSDQVAVISRGKLICSGSPLLLRGKFGCGYQLIVSRQSSSLATSSGQQSVKSIASATNSGSDSESSNSQKEKNNNNISAAPKDFREDIDEIRSVSSNHHAECGSSNTSPSMIALASNTGCCQAGDFNADNSSSSSGATQSDVDRLMAFTKCLVPNASLLENYGNEVILTLPINDPEGNRHDYATFFRCLDSNMITLGFSNYGVSSNTLEKVFLTLCHLEQTNQLDMENIKQVVSSDNYMDMSAQQAIVGPTASQTLNRQSVGQHHTMNQRLPTTDIAVSGTMPNLKKQQRKPKLSSKKQLKEHPDLASTLTSNKTTGSGTNKRPIKSTQRKYCEPYLGGGASSKLDMSPSMQAAHNRPPLILVSGFRWRMKQMRALLAKRYYHTIHDWKSLFCMLFLPCLFIAIAMGMTLIKPKLAPDPILPMTPEIYGRSTMSFLNVDDVNANSVDYSLFVEELLGNQNFHQKMLAGASQFAVTSRFSSEQPDCPKPRDGWRTAKCPIIRGVERDLEPADYLLDIRKLNSFSKDSTMCQCDECPSYQQYYSSYESSAPITNMSANTSSNNQTSQTPTIGDLLLKYYLPKNQSLTASIDRPVYTQNGYVHLLKNIDINKYLLATYSHYFDRRWGGWSIHDGQKYVVDQNNLEQNRLILKTWFDNNGYHSMPSYLNTINNAILNLNLKIAHLRSSPIHNMSRKAVTNTTNSAITAPPSYRIITYSHPIQIVTSDMQDQTVMQRSGDVGIGLIILVGFVFIPTSFVFYIVRERTQEEKQLQRIFGVGSCFYWLAAIVWDMIILMIAVLLSACIIKIFQLPIYTARSNLSAVLTLLFLFGWSMTTLVYLLEKLFDEASVAFMVIYCLALFIGINTMVIRLLIDVFKLIQVSPLFKVYFEWIAMIFPPYTLLSGLVDITSNQLFTEVFELFDQDVYKNPFTMDMLGPHFIALAVEGALFLAMNVIIECARFGSFSSLKPSFNNGSRGDTNTVRQDNFLEDEDVAEERKRIMTSCEKNLSNQLELLNMNMTTTNNLVSTILNQANSDDDILKVVGVTKVFYSRSLTSDRPAVNDVSFGLPKGQVS